MTASLTPLEAQAIRMDRHRLTPRDLRREGLPANLLVLVQLLVFPSGRLRAAWHGRSRRTYCRADWATSRSPGPIWPNLPGTRPLTQVADMAVENVAGVGRFLDKALERSIQRRARLYNGIADGHSRAKPEADSIEPNRQQLAAIVGATDPRVKPTGFEFLSAQATPEPVGMARQTAIKVCAVQFAGRMLPGSRPGEGLILEPRQGRSVANVVVIPDCSQTPEMIAGLAEGRRPVAAWPGG